MWVRSLSWEDPLEEGMATHSSILAWRIPWTEEPGRAGSEAEPSLFLEVPCSDKGGNRHLFVNYH